MSEVSSCEYKPKSLTTAYTTPERPWQHIGVDLVCDLPISKDGNLHLLVAICYLSKYVIARPLKSKRSRDVIDQLRNIYLTLGTPEIIQHDQGPEFKSKVSLS